MQDYEMEYTFTFGTTGDKVSSSKLTIESFWWM